MPVQRQSILMCTSMPLAVPASVTRPKSGPFDGKVTRFFTSLLLPVDKARTGECSRCGACCEFLVRCPFLKQDSSGAARCGAYIVRPPQCRKYPRSAEEQIHQPCGFRFDGRRE